MMNQKGGSAKTTTAQHSAICMASSGKRVMIIDTDEQQTCYKFFERNHHKFPNGYDGVIDVAKGGVEIMSNLIEKHKDNYDYIFIDTAPALGDSMSKIINISDFIVICVQPTYKDIEATRSIADSVKAYKILDESKGAAICITRKPSTTNITDEISDLKSFKLPIMTSYFREYKKCYNIADKQGVGIIHLDSKVPSSEKAASDVHSFTKELIELVEGK